MRFNLIPALGTLVVAGAIPSILPVFIALFAVIVILVQHKSLLHFYKPYVSSIIGLGQFGQYLYFIYLQLMQFRCCIGIFLD